MVIKTPAELKADMPIGVTNGTSVQDIHNIVDSFESMIATAGTGGGTAGTTGIWTPQDSGVIEGTGKTAQQRLDNGLNFQAAINYCDANRKVLVVPRGTYEINLAGGLECAFYGFRWLGSRNGGIVQYADNTPIITFGKKDTTSTIETAAQMIDGVSVSYGNLQPDTNTNSNAVIFSRVWGGDYRNFEVGSVNQLRANATLMYRGVFCANGFFFSNNFTNFRIKHFNHQGLRLAVQGTGNNFTNIYISNGNLNQTVGTVTSCLTLSAGGAVIQENVWNQLNCEWSNCTAVFDFVNARNQVFNSLHIEGVANRDATPYFKLNSASTVVMNGLTLLNCQQVTDTTIFGMGWDSTAMVNSMSLENFNNQTPARSVNLVASDSGTIRNGFVKIASINFRSNSNLTWADVTAIDNIGVSWDQSRPLKELGGVLPMTPGVSTLGDVSAIVHGRQYRHTIRFNTPLTADRALTLTAKYDGNGIPGGQMQLPNGPTHRIWRTAAASGSFVLTVNTSPNADGTSPVAIGTLAPGEYMDVLFDGGAWMKVVGGTDTGGAAVTAGSDVIAKTASYTAATTETSKFFTLNSASLNTFTVPAAAPAGWEVAVLQIGTGQTTLAVGGTGTLHHPDGHTKISKQFGLVYLKVYDNAGTAPQVALTGDTAL